MTRLWLIALLVLAAAATPARASAEWQLKPFGGLTFGGASPFVDLDRVAGKAKLNLGVSALRLGEVFGLEGEVATTSGFFSGQTKVTQSHVATAGGGIVIALPRRISEYSLRPYAAAGVGLAHVSFSDGLKTSVFSDFLPTWDVGGGATGFVSRNVGVNWDVRLFRTIRAQQPISGVVVREGTLSFWRATMGFAIRL